ncbi:MAG: hypothetical protein LUD84_08460 [Clostridiales bacterium]|nr:hypothetical protein [Clostridiales bacterium]
MPAGLSGANQARLRGWPKAVLLREKDLSLPELLACGAAGGCMMSGFMRL